MDEGYGIKTMNWKVCDICGGKDMSGNGTGWSHYEQGIVYNGFPKIEDICVTCNKWFLDMIKERQEL
jgi:hypothetical protein